MANEPGPVKKIVDKVTDMAAELTPAGRAEIPCVPGSMPPTVDEPVEPHQPLPSKPDQSVPTPLSATGRPDGPSKTVRAQDGAFLTPGIDITDDALPAGRLFSCLDTQITRLGGPNFPQIPINRPHAAVNDMLRDGFHQDAVHTGVPYKPNSLDGGCPWRDWLTPGHALPCRHQFGAAEEQTVAAGQLCEDPADEVLPGQAREYREDGPGVPSCGGRRSAGADGQVADEVETGERFRAGDLGGELESGLDGKPGGQGDAFIADQLSSQSGQHLLNGLLGPVTGGVCAFVADVLDHRIERHRRGVHRSAFLSLWCRGAGGCAPPPVVRSGRREAAEQQVVAGRQLQQEASQQVRSGLVGSHAEDRADIPARRRFGRAFGPGGGGPHEPLRVQRFDGLKPEAG